LEEGEHLVQTSGKLVILDILLKEAAGPRSSRLDFAQMTRTIDIFQDYLEIRKYFYDASRWLRKSGRAFAAVQSFNGRTSTLKESKAKKTKSKVVSEEDKASITN